MDENLAKKADTLIVAKVELRVATGRDVPAEGVYDYLLPDGSIRHNVGPDNLSDEDRAEMDRDLQEWIEAGCPT